jgi:seryl-tRNA synthetase
MAPPGGPGPSGGEGAGDEHPRARDARRAEGLRARREERSEELKHMLAEDRTLAMSADAVQEMNKTLKKLSSEVKEKEAEVQELLKERAEERDEMREVRMSLREAPP